MNDPILTLPAKVDAMTAVGGKLYVAVGREIFAYDLPEKETFLSKLFKI